MPFSKALNINTADEPDFINVCAIKRVRKIKGTDSWMVYGDLVPGSVDAGIQINAEQYALLEEYAQAEQQEENKEEVMRPYTDQPTPSSTTPNTMPRCGVCRR